MPKKNVVLVKPGTTYFGEQGVTYNAGVSRKTTGSEKVCMNVLPMPPGVHSIPHIHKDIETIAYLLEGECTLFHGDKQKNWKIHVTKCILNLEVIEWTLTVTSHRHILM